MIKRTRWGWAFTVGFVALCIWLVSSTRFNLGIDLQGGSELRYKLDLSHITDDPAGVAAEVKDIIARRLDLYGLKEIRIAIEGQDRLVVTIPGGAADTKFIEEQIEKAGNLRLQLVAEDPPEDEKFWRDEESKYFEEKTKWAQAYRAWKARRDADPTLTEPAPVEPTPPEYIVREYWSREDPFDPDAQLQKEPKKWYNKVLVNRPEAIVEGSLIETAYFTYDDNRRPAVGFSMRGPGATQLGELTENHKNEFLAIVLDDRILSHPRIQSRITTNGIITGTFRPEEVTSLVTILKGGSLPTKPLLLSRDKVGSVSGEAAIAAGFKSVIVGLVAVAVVTAGYYLFAGLVANFALAINLLGVLAFVLCFHQTLTIPGIAGILLSVGMAIDANVLIYERVREERKRGKTLVQSLNTGYQRAFSAIFDSNLTTVISGLVLFNFGTGPVKGFAVTLIAGIVISFFSAIFVTRLVLATALNLGVLKKFHMLEAFQTPSFGFMRVARLSLVISAVVIVVTWCVVLARGKENYGIDFTGGARIGMTLSKALEREEVESMLEGLEKEHPDLFRDWSLQEVQTEGRESREYVLLTRAGVEGARTAEAQEAQLPAAAEPQPPSQPQSQPQPQTEGAAAGGAEAEGGATAVVEPDAAQRVREQLEIALKARNLLLPETFEGSRWTQVGDRSKFELAVHVEGRLDDVSTEDIRIELNRVLAENRTLAESFEKSSTKLEAEQFVLEERAEDDVWTRYRVHFAPYNPPAVTVLSDGVPSKEQFESAVRSAFNDERIKKRVRLCDPFPTVSTVGPVVASDLQGKALIALFISVLGIIFYISLRFDFIFGLAAILALLHDVLVAIGVVSVTDALFGHVYAIKVNLPEVAAILTLIGYSINDTIVVFDRIRENLKLYGRKKMGFSELIDLSINQTLIRTLWTGVTTLLTLLALLFLGGEAVRGFAYYFLIGLITGTYSSVFIASPILLWLHNRAEKRRETLAADLVA